MKIKISILINDFFFNYYKTFYKLLKEKDSIFDVKALAVDGYNDKNKKCKEKRENDSRFCIS